MHTCSLASLLFVLATLAAPAALRAAGQVYISEFMASNIAAKADEDGDYSDWIELYNASDATVDLAGFALTDDASVPRKWVFPSVMLDAGKFLLVFASGKDRRDPARELHTNFELLAAGEYLALVAADSVTVVHAFARYPSQVDDVSYGFAQNSSSLPVIGPQTTARVLVPSNDAVDATWAGADFDDRTWTSGTLGVGFDRSPDYLPLIGIDLRTQMDTINCTAYLRLPFSVASAAEVSQFRLRMKYDDGFVAYVNGVEIMRRNAPAGCVWNSCASAIHDDAAAVVFEQYEATATTGLLRDGANVLAIHGLNSQGSTDFLIVPELDIVAAGTLDASTAYFLTSPSPGYANGTGFPQVAAAPGFSRGNGVSASTFALTLSAATSGAVIRYALSWDGQQPSAWSVYSTPIAITQNSLVRAYVSAPECVPSPIVTRAYTILAASTVGFTSNLPVLVINTFGRSIPGDPLVPGFLQVFEPGAGRTALNAPPQLQSIIGIKVRGSSSSGFPKQSFSLELWNEHGSDTAAPVLGFPPESDWVLYAPYSDKTLMRNALAYGWSNDIGRYAVRTRFVELFLKTGSGALLSGDYFGVYVFMEKIKRDEDRIDVTKLLKSQNAPPEITGGYMIKVDRLDPGDVGFSTARGTALCYIDPKEADITAQQAAYIKNYVTAFETALFGANFRDPASGYAAYVDVDSFVDHFILNELVKNIDAFRLSAFFYKDRNGKLVSEPLWDCDLALGNAEYLDGWIPTGWYLDLAGGGNGLDWWKRMRQDPDFEQKINDRWTAIARTQLAPAALLGRVEQYAQLLNEAQTRNFAKWPILGVYVWPNPTKYIAIGPTWQDELTWMKSWISARAAWMTSLYLSAPTLGQAGGFVPRNFALPITTPAGSIYYTTDGSDPRLSGGAISAHAVLYSGPITIAKNTLVRTRARQTTRWSGLIEATFVVDPPVLTVTEIMYHPSSSAPPSPYADNDFEFIELYNKSAAPADLTGVRFTNGIEFACPEGMVLDAGAYAVIVKNPDAFAARYGTADILVLGQYTGSLSNGGERIALTGAAGETLLDFTYDDAWYPETDGNGRSLVLADVQTAPSFFSNAETWNASTEDDGSPGAEDPATTVPGGWQRPGDANQDGRLDISDAIGFLRLLFAGSGLTLPCDGATIQEGATRTLLDLNGDATVNVADPVYLLAYLFAHGPPPALGASCVRIEGCPRLCR